MTTIYFQPISGSASGSGVATVYIDYTGEPTSADRDSINPQINPSEIVGSKVLTYTDSIVTITGSFSSGSTDRVAIYSTLSRLLASFPVEDTTVIYLNESGSLDNLYPFDYTSSLVNNFFGLEYNFIPSQTITSSLNRLAIYSGSTNVTYSINFSQSLASGFTTLDAFVTYSIELSGSGLYYTSSLKIQDTIYGNVLVNITASNSYISTSFTASQQGVQSNYRLTAVTEQWPSILLEYGSAANIPIVNSGSVNEWNSLLGIAASKVELSGGNVYLLGGILTNTGSLSIFYPASSSLVNEGLLKLSTQGLSDLQVLRIETGSGTGPLVEFPTIAGSNLSSFTVVGQQITGSTPNILSYGNVVEVNCSLNQLDAGILPFNSQSAATLYSFDCSRNITLTGSIPNIAHLYNLAIFDCRLNGLSGNLPTLPTNIQYFDCENNNISGILTIPTGSRSLYYYNVSSNQLSGSVPFFTSSIFTSPFIDVDVSSNNLTGSINFADFTSNLRNFDASNNELSGSLDGVNIPSLGGCQNLEVFRIDNNQITGSIFHLSANPNLTTFSARNNNINALGNPSNELGFSVASSLTYFDLAYNNLPTQSVTHLAEAFWLVFSGSFVSGTLSGIIDITGSGNAPPDSTARSYFNDLTESLWLVYANDYPLSPYAEALGY